MTNGCLSLAKQLMLAVGDSGGTLHILEVPWTLSHSSANEVSPFPSLPVLLAFYPTCQHIYAVEHNTHIIRLSNTAMILDKSIYGVWRAQRMLTDDPMS